MRTEAARTTRPIAWAPRWTGDGPRFVDELVGWLLSVGRRTYDGHVTLLEHALQTAVDMDQMAYDVLARGAYAMGTRYLNDPAPVERSFRMFAP